MLYFAASPPRCNLFLVPCLAGCFWPPFFTGFRGLGCSTLLLIYILFVLEFHVCPQQHSHFLLLSLLG